MSTSPPIFTATSAYSLAFVSAVGVAAYVASKSLLPKNASWQDRVTFIWLVSSTRTAYSAAPRLSVLCACIQAFDGIIHYTLEGSFLYYSMFGKQVITSAGPMAQMCTSSLFPTYGLQFMLASGKEYALADSRWGTADPTVVSLEILTVFGVGTMCFYVLKQLVQRDPTRHYWIIVLSTSEIYGGYVFGLWTPRCGRLTRTVAL